MERDNLNHGVDSTHLPSNKDRAVECNNSINFDENGGGSNPMSVPCRLPSISPCPQRDIIRMPQRIFGTDIPVDKQSGIDQGLQTGTGNSPNSHSSIPDSMNYVSRDSIVNGNSMQNVATGLRDIQTPQSGRVFEQATFDPNIQMARPNHVENSDNIYMSSLAENFGNSDNSVSALPQTSLGENVTRSDSVPPDSIQSQENFDGSFLTLGMEGNMDVQSMENSWSGTITSNSQSVIFPQEHSNIQTAITSPSEAVPGGHFGSTGYMNEDVLIIDNLGRSGSLAVGLSSADHVANSNDIYMSSFAGNVQNFNNSSSALSKTSLGEETGTSNCVLPGSIQSQENFDGSSLTLGIYGNMDPQSMGNSWSGTVPSNSQSLVIPQVSSDVQTAITSPSEAVPDKYFGSTGDMYRDVLTLDDLGRLGSPAAGFSSGQLHAPEMLQADRQLSIPPVNRNLEGNALACKIIIDPGTLSHGSSIVTPVPGFSGQAELPNSRQFKGNEIPILNSNSVQQGASMLNNQHLLPPTGQLIRTGEPMSVKDNAQTVFNTWPRYSAHHIGGFWSQSSATIGLANWRNNSGNIGQPQSAAAVQPSRNYPSITTCQTASVQTPVASSLAFPVHVRPSLKRSAADLPTSTSLVQQKRNQTTQPSLDQSVPNVPLNPGAFLSSAQTISSLPSQVITAQSTPQFPFAASLLQFPRPSSPFITFPQGPSSFSPFSRTSSSVITVPQAASSLPPFPVTSSYVITVPQAATSIPPFQGTSPFVPVSRAASSLPSFPSTTVAPILPSGPRAAAVHKPVPYRVGSSSVPVPVLHQRIPLADSTPEVHSVGQGFNETRQPVGEKCFLCKRDLSFTPEGPFSQPATPPDVAVLPCRHAFHDICLQKITPPDEVFSPPCIPCAIEEA